MYKTSRGKIVLEAKEKQFIRDNYQTMTNKELADALGLKLTRTRTLMYEMGLKRMTLEFWTEAQVLYLKNNYKTKGDTELAEIFNKKWHKNKGWTKKHIEKKRRYLKLKRTKPERDAIRERHRQAGVYKKANARMWQKRGITPVGVIKVWKGGPVIKLEDGFVYYHPWLWAKHYGDPLGKLVVPKKGVVKTICAIEDLELITRAEHARRNAELRKQYPSELKQLIKLKNKLLKQLKTQTHE